ncbi:MAG: DUF2752 domain-containing protein [Ktedonobacteraceae bacterium]|nr:DUF2752 domain-containing protein [Chloroflexota bacterium]
MNNEARIALGKIAAYLLLPLGFVLIPVSWFEARRSICLIRNLCGFPCPGCGMTRALACVLHGDFKKALSYNKLIVLVFPLLCYVWLQSVSAEYRRYRLSRGYGGSHA